MGSGKSTIGAILAKKLNLEAKEIGKLNGKFLQIIEKSGKSEKISIEKIQNIRNNWFKNYFKE